MTAVVSVNHLVVGSNPTTGAISETINFIGGFFCFRGFHWASGVILACVGGAVYLSCCVL